MNHDAYIGKLNKEETETLFAAVLAYLDNDQIARILYNELDSTDYAELLTQLKAVATE